MLIYVYIQYTFLQGTLFSIYIFVVTNIARKHGSASVSVQFLRNATEFSGKHEEPETIRTSSFGKSDWIQAQLPFNFHDRKGLPVKKAS